MAYFLNLHHPRHQDSHRFDRGHTKYCLVNGETIEMPVKKRRFMMGNALVVNLISQMEPYLDEIISSED